MKVLLINGSPRQEGNTATALAEVAKQLTKEGIESEIVWIGNKPIRGCIACGQCKEKGLCRCIFDDDICNKISEKFEESNALIIQLFFCKEMTPNEIAELMGISPKTVYTRLARGKKLLLETLKGAKING